MKKAERARYAAILLLTAVAVMNIATYAWHDPRVNSDVKTLLSRLRAINAPHGFDSLFAELKPLLKDQRVIGYAAQTVPEEMNINVEASALYYQTQYSLCPVIVDYSPEHEHVVALILARDLPLNLNGNAYYVVQQATTGAILFKRR